MLNRKRSFSFSCINMENFTSLEASELRALVHRRSASDSLSPELDLVKHKPGVGDNFTLGDHHLEPHSNGDDTISHLNYDNEISENSSFPPEKTPSFSGGMTLFLDLSSKTEFQKGGRTSHPGMYPRKIQRMLANRESAQRCRRRKLEYIDKLKRDIDAEEARLSMMSPQVSYYETRCKILKIKNNEMKDDMESLENEKASKQAEFQALTEELDALGVSHTLLKERK